MLLHTNGDGSDFPVHSETIYPDMTMFPTSVYEPVTTSAYSFPNVSCDTTGSGTMALQNLYVYAWSGTNTITQGIAWFRKDPVTGSTIDSGFINVPTSKRGLQVGIIQHAGGSQYTLSLIKN